MNEYNDKTVKKDLIKIIEKQKQEIIDLKIDSLSDNNDFEVKRLENELIKYKVELYNALYVDRITKIQMVRTNALNYNKFREDLTQAKKESLEKGL